MLKSSKSIFIVFCIFISLLLGTLYFKSKYTVIEKKDINSLLMAVTTKDDTELNYDTRDYVKRTIKANNSEGVLNKASYSIKKNGNLYIIHTLSKVDGENEFTVYYKKLK